jgi:diguanylate cyclase (GGDEF)-like protein
MSGSEKQSIHDRVVIGSGTHDAPSQISVRTRQGKGCTDISCNQEIMRLHRQIADLQKANEKLQNTVSQHKLRVAELEQSNTRDDLTGVFNRRFLTKIATKIIAQEMRKKNAWGALFVDIDDFKNINDTYGHACGDEVLKNITKMMREVSRESDFVVRTGGDEFLIIMLDVHEKDMSMLAQRYASAIGATLTTWNERNVYITVSIGACFVPGDGLMDLEQVLINADRSLYKAKAQGKARVVEWKERRKKT